MNEKLLRLLNEWEKDIREHYPFHRGTIHVVADIEKIMEGKDNG